MRPRFAEPQAKAAAVPSLSGVMWKMLMATPLVALSVWAGLAIARLIP